jgi:hypothetical protein
MPIRNLLTSRTLVSRTQSGACILFRQVTGAGVPIPQIDTDSALDIRPLFGDTATPVIDPQGGIIYVVSALKDTGALPAAHPYEQLLWAINLKSGQPVNGSPIVINPKFNGPFPGDNRTPCSQTTYVPNTPADNGCENDNEPAAPAGTIPFYPLKSPGCITNPCIVSRAVRRFKP